MKKLMFLFYMGLLFLMSVIKPVSAALIQPIGGILEATAYASVDFNYDGEKIIKTIDFGAEYGTRTISSSTSAGPDEWGESSRASASVSTNVSTDRIVISSAGGVSAAHVGPGVYCCANAFTEVNLEFHIMSSSAISLDFENFSDFESASARLDSASGTIWASTLLGYGDGPIHEGLFLSSGNYNIIFSSSSWPGEYGGVFHQDLFSITTVPIPTSLWLFCSSLTVMMGFSRRKQRPC